MRVPFNDNYPITQKFGANPEVYKRFGLFAHNGLDHAVPCGTNLYAMITGTVIEAGNNPTGYGLYIKIENDKEGALVAHLSNQTVSPGQQVKEGETLIGKSGTTGFSSGCHTHTAYFLKPRNRSNGYDGWIDPIPYLTEGGDMIPPDVQKKASFGDEIVHARDGIDADINKYDDQKKKDFISRMMREMERAVKFDKVVIALMGNSADSNKVTAQEVIDKAEQDTWPEKLKKIQDLLKSL